MSPLVDLKLPQQIVDKVKAALETAVGILNDKDGWKVDFNFFVFHHLYLQGGMQFKFVHKSM